jgi:hypothetical protein
MCEYLERVNLIRQFPLSIWAILFSKTHASIILVWSIAVDWALAKPHNHVHHHIGSVSSSA